MKNQGLRWRKGSPSPPEEHREFSRPENKPSRRNPAAGQSLTLRQLRDAVALALHAAVHPEALVLSREYKQYLTSRMEWKTLGWQAFRVVAEGSYLLAHGLTFDNLVMQVFMLAHLTCVLVHVSNRAFWVRWREEMCMGMNIMYSTVSFLKLFNVVPRLLNEDNFLMKYLVLYLADAYFCQVPVHKFYKLQFADASLRWFWWRLYNVMPGMPYVVLIVTSLAWQAFLLTFSASLQAGHVADFKRVHGATASAGSGAGGSTGPSAAKPVSTATATTALPASALPAAELPSSRSCGPPAGSAHGESASSARETTRALAPQAQEPGLSGLARAHEARAPLAQLADSGAHQAFAAALLGSGLSSSGLSSSLVASDYMAALSSVGSGPPSGYLLSHEPRWSQLVAAALRSGNLGFVTAPVSSSRTSTVQLYLTAADPCHLPARWVGRVSAAISRGAPGWHLVSASCRQGSLVVHLDLVGITPLEPHTPAQVSAHPHPTSPPHLHADTRRRRQPLDLHVQSAAEPREASRFVQQQPGVPPFPSAPPNSTGPAPVCSSRLRQQPQQPLQQPQQAPGVGLGVSGLPPGSREALEAYLEHLDPSGVMDLLGLEGMPEPQLGDVIAIQSEGLNAGGGGGRGGDGDGHSPRTCSSSSCGSSTRPAEGVQGSGSPGCVRIFRVVEPRPLRNCASLLRQAEVDRHKQQSGSSSREHVTARVAASSTHPSSHTNAHGAKAAHAAAAQLGGAGIYTGCNIAMDGELWCAADDDHLAGLRTPELPARGRRWQKLRLQPASEAWGDAFGSLGGAPQPNNATRSHNARQALDDAIALLEMGDIKGIDWQELEAATSGGHALAELLGTGRASMGGHTAAPRVPPMETDAGAASSRLRGVHLHAFGEKLLPLGVLDSLLAGPLVQHSAAGSARVPAAATGDVKGAVGGADAVAAAAPWRHLSPHDISLDRRVVVLASRGTASLAQAQATPGACLQVSFTCPAGAVPGIKVVLRHISPSSFVTGLHCAKQAEEVSRTLEPNTLRAGGCDTPDTAPQRFTIRVAISSSIRAASSSGAPSTNAPSRQQAAAADEGPGLLHVELWHQRRRLSSHPVLLLADTAAEAAALAKAPPTTVAAAVESKEAEPQACGVVAWGAEVEGYVHRLLREGHKAVANQLVEDLGTWLAQVAAIERGLLDDPAAAAAATQRIAQVMHVHHFQGGHVAADLLAAAWVPQSAAQQAPPAAAPSGTPNTAEEAGAQSHSGSAAAAGRTHAGAAGAVVNVPAVNTPVGVPDALLQLLICQGSMLLAMVVEAGAPRLAAHLKGLLCGALAAPLRRVLDMATAPLTSLPLLHAAIKSGNLNMVAQVVGWHTEAGTLPYEVWTAEVLVHAASLVPNASGAPMKAGVVEGVPAAAAAPGRDDDDGGDEFFEMLLSAQGPVGLGKPLRPPAWSPAPSNSPGGCAVQVARMQTPGEHRAATSGTAVSHVRCGTGAGASPRDGVHSPAHPDAAQAHEAPGAGGKFAGGGAVRDPAAPPLRALAFGGGRDREGSTRVVHVQRQARWEADASEYASGSCAAASQAATALLLGTHISRSCADGAASAASAASLSCGGAATAPVPAETPEAHAMSSGGGHPGVCAAVAPLLLLDGGLLLVTPLHLALALPDGGRLLAHILESYPEAKGIWDASAHAARPALGSSVPNSLRSSLSYDGDEASLRQPGLQVQGPNLTVGGPRLSPHGVDAATEAAAAATEMETAQTTASFATISDCGTLTDAATATARTSAACDGSCYSRATSRPSAQMRPVSGGMGATASGYLFPSDPRLSSGTRSRQTGAAGMLGGDGR